MSLTQVLLTFKVKTVSKSTGCNSLDVVFPKGSCVRDFVPSVVLFIVDGTFKRWSLMGGD